MTQASKPLRIALFDLDQTLYPVDSGLMVEMGQRINRYLKERCRFTDREVKELRDQYYRQYGTTLRGLMLHHSVDADDYLDFVHDLNLEKCIHPSPAIQAMLAQVQLEKVVFTNASESHARRVLQLLGVEEQFSAVIDVKAVEYLNKPDPRAYEKALEILGVSPEECLVVDDLDRNLAAARSLGMVTVLVGAAQSDVAEFAIARIEMLPEVLNALDGRIADPPEPQRD